MIGIKSYGVYLPKYLLSRKKIADTWGFPTVPGNKTVANYDEDSVTMAIEAGIDCLWGFDKSMIDGLYFATTTQPYTEKNSSSLIATVLDLKKEIITQDFTDSLNAGASAIARAYDTIKSNDDIKNIIVIASDTRAPEPSTMSEYIMSDGAAAFLIGEGSAEDILVSIENYYAISDNVTGPWKRTVEDKFVRQFELKHEAMYGYIHNITSAMKGIMDKNNLKPEDFGIVVFYYNNPTLLGRISKLMKFSQAQIQDSLFFSLGDTGTPFSFMLLITALKRVKPDQKILFAGYGDGAIAFYMKIISDRGLRNIKKTRMGMIKSEKTMTELDNYNKFIDNRKYLEKDRYIRKSSPVTIWRDSASIYPMHGIKCNACGVVQYPIATICVECGSRDLTEVPLKLKGKIFTYTLDHLVGGDYYSKPTPRCVIDLDGGGRVLCDMTESEKPEQEVEIDMEVELTFRKIHEGANFVNYYWKCRPVRGRP
jgi:hydroxymethylglutaryl-CoA synthase